MSLLENRGSVKKEVAAVHHLAPWRWLLLPQPASFHLPSMHIRSLITDRLLSVISAHEHGFKDFSVISEVSLGGSVLKATRSSQNPLESWRTSRK